MLLDIIQINILCRMKIQNAKLPHASMLAGKLQTRNGALCITGKYSLYYDGL
jgi:hypothetical protein